MAYKQNWGLSRRHYQGNTSPMNRMPHMNRLEKQSQTKFAGIDEEILPPSPLGNCGCPSPLNQEYGEVINEAITQKANPAQVSAKLRETFPEVKDNSVEVNWSPGGEEVEVYNMTPDATEEESKAVRDKFDKTYMQGDSGGENKLKEAFKSVAKNVAMTPFITPVSGVVTGLKTAYDIYKKNKK